MDRLKTGEARRWTVFAFLLVLAATGIVNLWFAAVAFLVALLWLALTSERLSSKAHRLTVLRCTLLGAPLPVIETEDPGGWDSEVQGQEALERLPPLLNGVNDEIAKLGKDLPGHSKRIAAGIAWGGANKVRAASKVARALRKRNEKIAKYALPAHHEMNRLVDGYLGTIDWLLAQENQNEAALHAWAVVFEGLVRPVKENKPHVESLLNTTRGLRKLNATRDFNEALDRLIETLDLIVQGMARMESELPPLVDRLTKRIKP